MHLDRQLSLNFSLRFQTESILLFRFDVRMLLARHRRKKLINAECMRSNFLAFYALVCIRSSLSFGLKL